MSDMTAAQQARDAQYYYSKGIGTGLGMAIEICEGLRPTTSTVVLEALKAKMEDVCKKK